MKAYADQLALKGDYFAAASYYVAVNQVREAIEMFKAQNMFKYVFDYDIKSEQFFLIQAS